MNETPTTTTAADEPKQLFDTREPFLVRILSGGKIEARLRYPSDKDWIDRTKHQVHRQEIIGRGKSQDVRTPMEDFDLELFNRCLIEQPARAWDEYEASLAIATLGVCSIEAGEFETDELIRVELGVFGNRTTTVWLNIPRRREIVEFSRAAVKTVTTTKASETRVNLEPSARLFDSVFVKAEGYAEGSAIPVPHKDVAIVKLLELVNGANGGEA